MPLVAAHNMKKILRRLYYFEVSSNLGLYAGSGSDAPEEEEEEEEYNRIDDGAGSEAEVGEGVGSDEVADGGNLTPDLSSTALTESNVEELVEEEEEEEEVVGQSVAMEGSDYGVVDTFSDSYDEPDWFGSSSSHGVDGDSIITFLQWRALLLANLKIKIDNKSDNESTVLMPLADSVRPSESAPSSDDDSGAEKVVGSGEEDEYISALDSSKSDSLFRAVGVFEAIRFYTTGVASQGIHRYPSSSAILIELFDSYCFYSSRSNKEFLDGNSCEAVNNSLSILRDFRTAENSAQECSALVKTILLSRLVEKFYVLAASGSKKKKQIVLLDNSFPLLCLFIVRFGQIRYKLGKNRSWRPFYSFLIKLYFIKKILEKLFARGWADFKLFS